MLAKLRVSAALAAALLILPAGASALPAFPNAVGYGRDVQGGRAPNAVVCKVTHLGDAGPNSLRDCLTRTGPRYVVFAVGGRITLNSTVFARGDVTISGQAAPGDGIEIVTPDQTAWCGAMIVFKGATNGDVVMRQLRLRPGRPASSSCRRDPVVFENTGDAGLMLDHVSIAFGGDENLDLYKNNRNITVSSSVIAFGLLSHSKGALVCDGSTSCGRITFFRNAFVANRDRNPDIHAQPGVGTVVDFINNVVYNPKDGTEVWRDRGGSWVQVLGNDYRRGPNSNGYTAAVRIHDINPLGKARVHAPFSGTYANVSDLGQRLVVSGGDMSQVATAPMAAPSAPVGSAAGVWEVIRNDVGNVLPRRDVLDTAILECVAERVGCGFIAVPPARPAPASGTAPADRDGDAMPDAWEAANGTNPAAPDPNADADRDGYPNIEDWLHGI